MSDPSMSSTQAQQPAIKKQHKKIIGLIAILLVLIVAATVIGVKPAHAASTLATYTIHIGKDDPGVIVNEVDNGTGLSSGCVNGPATLNPGADPNTQLTVIYFNTSNCTGSSHQITLQLGSADSPLNQNTFYV
jgi:hypothetical protein